MIDIDGLDDAALDQLRRRVLAEQERRANLAAIPDQIKELAEKFRDGGGDEDALIGALTPEQALAAIRNQLATYTSTPSPL